MGLMCIQTVLFAHLQEFSASGHLLRTKAKTLKVSPAWKHFPSVEMLCSKPGQQSVGVLHNFWSL